MSDSDNIATQVPGEGVLDKRLVGHMTAIFPDMDRW